MSWCVYIIRCKGGLLYTGITNDLDRRIAVHNTGKGCKFTRSRIPVKLLYSQSGFTKSGALVREAEIKRLKRVDKLKLVKLERKEQKK